MRRISMLSGLAVLAAMTFSQTGLAQASPTPQSVSAHVQQAVAALQDFRVAVRNGDDSAAHRALQRNRRQTAIAAREANALGGSGGVSAKAKVARLKARNLSNYVGAFPLAGANLQLDLTGLIADAVEACGSAADQVEAAANYVPAADRDRVLAAARAIRDACASAFPDGGASTGDITTVAIQQCHDAIAQFNSLIDELLSAVPANLPFASFLSGLTNPITNLLHTVTAQADAACELLGGIGASPGEGITGIFGDWLGGSNLGLGDITGILTHLFGDGSGTSSGGGLLDGLLGGLFGGGSGSGLLGGLFGGGGSGS